VEPPVHRLPRQVYLWSSSFLQSCYYFDPLVRSPFKAIRRVLNDWMRARESRFGAPAPAALAAGDQTIALPGFWAPGGTARPRQESGDGGASGADRRSTTSGTGRERRQVSEPYRQAFGRERTAEHGRPAGWMLTMSAVEKVFFPTTLLVMIILRNWEGLAVTVAAETAVCVAALVAVMKGQRLTYLLKGLLATPIRYALMLSELFTIGRFATDLWVRKDRRWRK
jgi:hypothetical protein